MKTFRPFTMTLAVTASLSLASFAVAAQTTKGQTDCGRIDAVLDKVGPSVRADELSKKTGMDINSVRKCMEAWKSASNTAPSAPVTGRTTNMPSGCTKVAAALDQSGDTLSADELARRTGNDVPTVRDCTDMWRAVHTKH